MKTKIKLWARRLMLRWLRKAFDAAEEKLHAAEVRFRERIPVPLPLEPASVARPQRPTVSCPHPFPSDELLRHRIHRWVSRGGEPQRAGKKKISAADFDRRFEKVTP